MLRSAFSRCHASRPEGGHYEEPGGVRAWGAAEVVLGNLCRGHHPDPAGIGLCCCGLRDC